MEITSVPLEYLGNALFSGVVLLSFFFMILVTYNFRTSMKTRSIFFQAVVGDSARNLFRWSRFLLVAYIVTILIVTVASVFFYYFPPHFL